MNAPVIITRDEVLRLRGEGLTLSAIAARTGLGYEKVKRLSRGACRAAGWRRLDKAALRSALAEGLDDEAAAARLGCAVKTVASYRRGWGALDRADLPMIVATLLTALDRAADEGDMHPDVGATERSALRAWLKRVKA